KKALSKKVAEEYMQFVLLNGKLSINARDISTKEIIALINKSRLKASTWDEYISKNHDTNFYSKYSMLITKIPSGMVI
ncbi:cadmium transporter, partial [Francisella tularensis subsp. holarctica]|nr:cadmium transporter [Francisella tularensis subsp. holarctica]